VAAPGEGAATGFSGIGQTRAGSVVPEVVVAVPTGAGRDGRPGRRRSPVVPAGRCFTWNEGPRTSGARRECRRRRVRVPTGRTNSAPDAEFRPLGTPAVRAVHRRSCRPLFHV